MAKRRKYHNSKKSNTVMHPKMRRQMEDSMMIHEDHSKIANLPQEVRYHEWPRYDYGQKYNIDDTIRGVDKQINADMKGLKKGFAPEKY